MRRIPLHIAFGLVTALLSFPGLASAECPTTDANLPQSPLSYPMTSDQYAVQFRIGAGSWTPATVYISYYGKTNASPLRGNSGYTRGTTSMSFVSIPAMASALVQVRVTKLSGGPFQASDHVAVRPTPKLVAVQTQKDGTVQFATLTPGNFGGEQFMLWWNRGTDGGGVEGLAFFLNPPYTEPTGTNVKRVTSSADLTGDLSGFDTLDFESPTPTAAVAIALGVYQVPDNILTIFLGPTAWVQGKLQFNPLNSTTRSIYGPGVLDGSQFNYLNRDCTNLDGSPTADGLYALSSSGNGLKNFVIDGIIISDHNHAANDPFYSTTVNNVKTLGWNSNNAALRLNDSTRVSNVFIRSSDDALMIWGTSVTVTNATVWQGFNGGVVNLGWSNNSAGDYNLVDGLWVVKTDWLEPTVQSWDAVSQQPGLPNPLASQNNAVFASLMVPSTMYGQVSPPIFRNIFVEDPPQVLFSLKIAPSVNCPDTFCTAAFLQQSSKVSLNIQNLYSPQSTIENSIGFQTLPQGYTTMTGDTFPASYTLTGTMKVGLTNVLVKVPSGFVLPLVSLDAAPVGKISTNGAALVKYVP